MVDVAELGLKVDSTPVDSAREKLDALTASARKTEEASKALGASFSTSGVQAKDLLNNTNLSATAKARLTEQINKQTAATNTVTGASKGLSASQAKMIDDMGSLVVQTNLLNQGKGREAAIHSALRRAETTADTEYGRTVAGLAGTLFDLERQQGAAATNMQRRMMMYASSFGMAGSAIARLGPIGLATGVGLAVLVKTFDALADRAANFAERASRLKDVADTTGMSVRALQQFQVIGQGVGVSTEKSATSLLFFSQNMEMLRRGAGPLAEELKRVGGGLFDQLRLTESNEEALILLARAYETAGEGARTLIAKAAFGRGNIGTGRILPEISEKGLAGAAASQGKFFEMSKKSTEELSRLKNTLDLIKQSNSDTFDNMFSVAVLNRLTQMHSMVGGVLSFMQKIQSTPLESLSDMGAGMPEGMAPKTSVPSVRPIVAPPQPPAPVDYGPTKEQMVRLLEQETRQLETNIAAMGNSATATQLLALRYKQLAVDVNTGKITEEAYSQALKGIPIMQAVAEDNVRIGVLNESASVTEKLTAKTRELQSIRMINSNVSQSDADRALRAMQQQLGAADLQKKTELGIATSADFAAQKMRDFQVAIDNGTISINNQGAAAAALTRKYREMAERAAVAASSTPGLTQMAFDLANTDKQFDQFATGSLNNLSTALTDIATGTKSAGEAFKQLGTQVVRALTDMIIKMVIIQPIAQALQNTLKGGTGMGMGGGMGGLFGGLFGGGGNLADKGIGSGFGSGGFNFIDAQAMHSGGIVGVDRGPLRYVHPAYFDDAPRLHKGKMPFGAGEMPAIIRRDEAVLTPGQMKALGSPRMVNNISIQKYGNAEVEASEPKQNDTGGFNFELMVRDATDRNLSRGNHDGAMGRFVGGRPRSSRR